jgi:DNA polymerase-4
MRKIIHIDMDAFYAAVEVLDNPDLKGKCVIVGGSPEHRGVVCSASYEARRFGIHSAMPTYKALKLCPQAVMLPPRFHRYREISARLRGFFLEYTDLVEPIALDESYLDVTVNKKRIPLAGQIAKELKERIRTELSLTASAGVGPNKFVAKIASDMKKPDGLVIVTPGQVREFLDPLPVSKMWGVGEVTERKLCEMGVETIGDLARTGEETLADRFGKLGRFLFRLASGNDDRPVVGERDPKSISRETTFPRDTDDIPFITSILAELAKDVAGDLKKQDKAAATIVLKVRYHDFSSCTRSQTLGTPTDSADRILKTAVALMEKTEIGRTKIRLIGVGASGFAGPGEPRQLSLFGNE